jgi:hypothetical protein
MYHVREFRDKGFQIFSGVLNNHIELQAVIDDVKLLGKQFFGEKFSLEKPFVDGKRSELGIFYDSLRYSLSLQRLAASPQILELVNSLGIKHPISMHQDNIRMDEPNRNEVLFHWHQDITYLLGSHNSVTLWIPLGVTNMHYGTIGVKPLSEKRIMPVTFTNNEAGQKRSHLSPKDVLLADRVDDSDEEIIEAELGDIVAFSQYVLHRSRKNNSDNCRWTIQLRYSDLLEPGFVSAGMPIGDRTIFFNTNFYGEANMLIDSTSTRNLTEESF